MSNAPIDVDVSLLETYIGYDPIRYRKHIAHVAEDMLRRCAGYDLVAELAYAALGYAEACCRLEAPPVQSQDNQLIFTDIPTITGPLGQNMEDCLQRYTAALARYKEQQ